MLYTIIIKKLTTLSATNSHVLCGMKSTNFLSIVGFGPRGLFALEQFYLTIAKGNYENFPSTTIFETNRTLGTGKAWGLNQSDSNWSNISDRALEAFPHRPSFIIKDTKFPEFPSYANWLKEVMNHDPSETKDTFQPRKVIGTYLSQRATTLVERLVSMELLTVVNGRITSISKKDDVFTLIIEKGECYRAHHTILALGHLKTQISDQNKSFQEHAREKGIYFSKDCYSKGAENIYASAKAIAIKGLGLSMVDVVRMILDNYKGEFTEKKKSIFLEYKKSNKNLLIVPFSLDGLPLVPKPLGKHIDELFSIDKLRHEKLIKSLKDQVKNKQIKDVSEIIKPIATEVAVVYQSLKNKVLESKTTIKDIVEITLLWLLDPSTKHEIILDTDLPIIKYMMQTCEMAYGATAFTLDFVTGQIWRQLQPDLYQIYSHNLEPKILSELIQLDEKTKRYSYGPPVESVLQLIALEEAGILQLDFVNNPEINLVKNGFQLSFEDKNITLDAMIDAVIPSPNVVEINEPLIKNLRSSKLINQVEEKLGIEVTDDATHVVHDNRIDGLHSIGRNIKGNIYGVDAILECFNEKKISKLSHTLVAGFDHVQDSGIKN